MGNFSTAMTALNIMLKNASKSLDFGSLEIILCSTLLHIVVWTKRGYKWTEFFSLTFHVEKNENECNVTASY